MREYDVTSDTVNEAGYRLVAIRFRGTMDEEIYSFGPDSDHVNALDYVEDMINPPVKEFVSEIRGSEPENWPPAVPQQVNQVQSSVTAQNVVVDKEEPAKVEPPATSGTVAVPAKDKTAENK